jgi:hypothetical protein
MPQIEVQPLNEFYQGLERITVQPFWRRCGGRNGNTQSSMLIEVGPEPVEVLVVASGLR